MNLTAKGKKILKRFKQTYTVSEAKRIFNLMIEEKKLTKVEVKKKKK